MSRDGSLQECVSSLLQDQTLILHPLAPGNAQRRVLFLHRRVWGAMVDPDTFGFDSRDIAVLRADMDAFVSGKFLHDGFVKRLSSPDTKPAKSVDPNVWEIKCFDRAQSGRPDPNIRLFGRFIDKDVFVGTNFERRNRLKGKETPEWRAEILICQRLWAHMFANLEPFDGGVSNHDHVSGLV